MSITPETLKRILELAEYLNDHEDAYDQLESIHLIDEVCIHRKDLEKLYNDCCLMKAAIDKYGLYESDKINQEIRSQVSDYQNLLNSLHFHSWFITRFVWQQ